MQVNIRWFSGFLRSLALLFIFCSFSSSSLHADVGLLLSKSLEEGLGNWTSSGHAAVYLSRLCPETPVKVRLCRADEQGSVVSMYDTFGEDKQFEWNALPLSVFLYGVADESDRPLLAWSALRSLLQEHSRESFLAEVCQTEACVSEKSKNAHWRYMVASTFARDIYLFQAKTSVEQDVALMERLNSGKNVNHFHGATNNCADFAARVLNFYFPGSARADHINDFGVTSPKAIAKSFTHYGLRHPELEFHVFRFNQIPGTYPPSHDTRKGTEVFFRSKKLLFPLLLRPHELAVLVGSYTLTGRFNPEHELSSRPGADGALLREETGAGNMESLPAHIQPVALADYADLVVTPKQVRPRDKILGTSEQWKSYREAFDEMTGEAVNKKLIPKEKALHKVVKKLGEHGRTSLDADGAAWLEVNEDHVSRQVGVLASNINAHDSDPELAYLIMLARVDEMLHRSAKGRELMPYFERDWALLQEARQRLWPAPMRASGSRMGTTRGSESIAPR